MKQSTLLSILLAAVALALTIGLLVGGFAQIALAAIGVFFFASPVFSPLLLSGAVCVAAGGLFLLRVVLPAWRLNAKATDDLEN